MEDSAQAGLPRDLAPPSPPPCTSLPLETLDAILQHLLCLFDSPIEAQAARFIFDRVCRSWYSTASLHELALAGSAQARRWIRHFWREKADAEAIGRQFRSRVEKLYLKTQRPHHSDKSWKGGGLLADVLGTCSSELKELEMIFDSGMGTPGGPHWLFSESVNTSVWSQLVAIKKLILSVDLHGPWASTFDAFDPLLQSLAALTHLTFRTNGTFLLRPLPPFPRMLSHLEVSVLSPTNQVNGNLEVLLRLLVESSRHTLQCLRVSLTMGRPDHLNEIVRTIKLVAPRLLEFRGNWLSRDVGGVGTSQDAMLFVSLYEQMQGICTLSLSDTNLAHLLPDLTTFAKLPSLRFASFDLAHQPAGTRASLENFIRAAPSLRSLSLQPAEVWVEEDLKAIKKQRKMPVWR